MSDFPTYILIMARICWKDIRDFKQFMYFFGGFRHFLNDFENF